jgi:hypothetical protein
MVAIAAPPGWEVSEDGLATAAELSGLSGDEPVAPRVRYVPTETTDADPASAGAAITDAMARATALLAGPEETTVGGQPALAVTVQEETASGDAIVRRYVVATTSDNRSALFVAEAPADEFEAESDEMLAAIDTN